METRANYVLIGSFALAGMIGLVAFFLWFARVELDRQFAYFDVRFTSVSGLSRASDVRFAGLPVGQVVDVRLSPTGDGTVMVRLEVASDTPVRADSVATIESQGVTGVSFVGISPGSSDEPLLSDADGVPEIQAGRSVLQTLSEDAPEIVTEVLRIVQQVGEILNEENQQRVQNILNSVEYSSSALGEALEDFAVVTNVIATASRDIALFAEKLEPAIEGVTHTLGVLDTALNSFNRIAARAESTLDVGEAALTSGRDVLEAAEVFIRNDLPPVVEELTETTRELRQQLHTLGSDAQDLMAEFRTTGSVATERLIEIQTTLSAAEEMIAGMTATLATVDRTATRFDTLLADEGAPLLAEIRAVVANADSAVAAISQVAVDDLPAIFADVRQATETAARVVEQVGADLSAAGGRIEGLGDDIETALAQITDTFANANETLVAIDRAMTTGERTLESAERAFAGADRVINEDIGAITADLRATMARFDQALSQVSDDIPGITADLRAATATANETFAELGRIVAASGTPIVSFAETGLPEYTRLARETRTLISNLERLARQIERDPARFFLSRQTPEFRR